MEEGGWDWTRNRAGPLGEGDSVVLSLFSTPKHGPSKYAKEGNIANNNNGYAIRDESNIECLVKGNNDNSTPIANDEAKEYIEGDDNAKYAKGKDDNEYTRVDDNTKNAEGDNNNR
jgi:hypothetical protein